MFINLIASPRNISTAFMYSLGQHSEVHPIDEPFYGCYLKETGKFHPDRELILQKQSHERNIVFQEIDFLASQYPVIFLKNMAHHIREDDFSSMTGWKHCFLIRHPRLHIHSFAKVISQPDLNDLGTTRQRKLYDILVANGQQPHIIDANQLLKHPENELRRFCQVVNIPFQESMLSWPRGPKPYDGSWASHWYRSVWKTTAFGPPRNPEDVVISPDLQPLLEVCLIDYQYLYDHIK